MSFYRQPEKTSEDLGDPFHAVIRMGGFVPLEQSHLSELNIRPKGDTPIGAAPNPAPDRLSDGRPSSRRRLVQALEPAERNSESCADSNLPRGTRQSRKTGFTGTAAGRTRKDAVPHGEGSAAQNIVAGKSQAARR